MGYRGLRPGIRYLIKKRWEGLSTTFDPSTLIANLFASKTDGDDADSGLTEDLAKETLDPGIEAIHSAGDVIGLNYGDEWQEQYDINYDNVKIIPYGTPANGLPIVSGMETQTGWSLVGAGPAYDKTITHSIGLAAGYNFILVAEIDETDELTAPLTSYIFLARTLSVAACEALAGSYYIDQNYTGSDVMTIHTSDGSNPNSNGKRYEVTVREGCIEHDARLGLVLYKLLLKASGDGFGQVITHENAWIQQCFFLGGGVHQAVAGAGIVDQCVFAGGPNASGGDIKFVWYMTDGTGLTSLFQNSIFFLDGQSGFYQHTSGGPTDYTLSSLINVYFFGDSNSAGIDAINITNDTLGFIMDGCYINNVGEAIGPHTQTVLIKNTVGTNMNAMLHMNHPSNPINNVVVENCLATINSVGTFLQSNISSTLIVRNCIVLVDHLTAAQSRIFTHGGSSTIWHNCIFIFDLDAAQPGYITDNADLDGGDTMVNGDSYDNVYILLSGTKLLWTIANPSNNLEIAQWKGTTTHDKNSQYYDFQALGLTLDDLFIDSANGDWRLNEATPYGQAAIALGAGMTTPILEYPTEPTREQAYAKMLDGSLVTETLNFGSNSTPDPAAAWIAAGSFSAGQQTIIEDFVANLQTVLTDDTNVWDRLVLLNLYIWANAANNGINGKDPGVNNPVFIGSPTHGATGVVLDGATQYIQLGVIPNQHLINHFVTLSRWTETNQNCTRDMGAIQSSTIGLDLDSKTGGALYWRAHGAGVGVGRFTVAITDNSELITCTRRGKNINGEVQIYRNGTSLYLEAEPSDNGTPPSIELYSGAINDSGVVKYAAADTRRLDMVARDMNDLQVQQWNTSVQQLMTDLGI